MCESPCDYNYRCLENPPMVCPHFPCEFQKVIQHRVDQLYTRTSYQRSKKGWTHSPAKRFDLKAIFVECLRDGFKCGYCRKEMTFNPQSKNNVTMDHKLSRGLGGDNSKENLLLCCYKCNHDKMKLENKVKSRRTLEIRDIIGGD